MKYLLTDKKTGRVKSISDGQIEFDDKIFDLKEIEITESEQSELDLGYIPFIENDKLKLEKPKHEKVKNIKGELSNAKTVDDVKNIINQLL
jgi:hypothetical protein